MEHQLDFTVTKDLVRAATRRFWLQFIGWGGLIRWAVISLALTVVSITSRYSWSYLLLLFAGGIPLIWVVGYVTFLRRAYERYARMQSKRVSYRFTEEGLGMASDLGRAEIPWRMLDKVQRHPDVWLLFFGRRDYAYFPATEVTGPLEDYIRRQAETHGIKF